MKLFIAAIYLPLFLTACERNEPAISKRPSVLIEDPAPPVAVPVLPAEEFGVAEEEPTTEIEIAPLAEPLAPTPTAGERLDHGIEKTEEGLRKAAEATGSGLRRLGETIERKADEQSR